MLQQALCPDAATRAKSLKSGTFGQILKRGGIKGGQTSAHQLALKWKSSNSLSDHDNSSSDGQDVGQDLAVLKPIWKKEQEAQPEEKDRLLGGWTRPVTIPCIGYIKSERVSYDSSCVPRGEDTESKLLKGQFIQTSTVSPPAWPSVLTRVFKVQSAKELIANVTMGNIAPELWDTHFANEEMLRYEAPLVKESFESFYDKIRSLTSSMLTVFLKRFDVYVETYDALRDLHGYKYLSAERDLIEQQSTSISRRYADISSLMDDPIIDAELGSQFFALEGQAFHYIAKLEEQMELNELAFYMNILSEDIVSDPMTAAMRQIKWAAKLVKTKRRVGEQLEGIYEWLRNFTNFMDDLRKVIDPLKRHWGHFGNMTPGSSPYSNGIASVIEAVQYYMGQVPAPIKSKFLVYLRGAGVKKARHAQDFRFGVFKAAMEFDAQLKQIENMMQEPDLWKFAGDGTSCGGELEMRVESLTKYAKGFFNMPFGSAEAIEGYGLEQELRARSDVFQHKAEAKLAP